jgi:uncharacterized membrane protein
MQEAAGASLAQDTVLHSANVAIHVLLGTAALALGVRQLASQKGDERHSRFGRWFLSCVWGAVGTASIGVLLFEFRAFLGVITLLVAYWAFAGYRTLRIRTSGPTLLDALGSLAGLGAVGLFLWHLSSVQFPWNPSVIYSTLGTLVAVAAYDLSRFMFPRRWFATLWLYEHVVKMIGAYSATLSAFAGTVLGGFQPYSQLLPSVVCTAIMIAFLLRVHRKELAAPDFATAQE